MKNPAKILHRQAKIIGEGIQESEFRIQKDLCLPCGRRNKKFRLPSLQLRTKNS